MFSEQELKDKSKNSGDFLRMLKARILAKRERLIENPGRRYNCTDKLVRYQPRILGHRVCRCCFDIGRHTIDYMLEEERIFFCGPECFRYYTSEIPGIRGKVERVQAP